jgi:hypothetical protein
MKSMDFFVWQGAGGVNSFAIHDERNAARRKKTRFHVALWVAIGISLSDVFGFPMRPAADHGEPGIPDATP